MKRFTTKYVTVRPGTVAAAAIRMFGKPCFGIIATAAGGTHQVSLGRRVCVGPIFGKMVEFSTTLRKETVPSEEEGYALVKKHLAGA